MRNMMKKMLSAAVALTMLLSLSITAFAADNVTAPLENGAVTLRLLSADEAMQIAAASDYTVRTSTVLLNRSNAGGTNGTKILSFTADHDTAIFTLTYAPNTSTYNVVCLDSEGNAITKYYKDIPMNNPVAADHLVVGEKYTFRVSSNDCAGSCTANYELKY